jgi:hypothetical protein
MRNGFVLAMLVSVLACGAAHAEGAPTQQQVQDWWRAKSSEALTIEGPLQEVHLMDKEVAYIAPVGFYERGRNFIWHSVLVRPVLQEVRELPEPIGSKVSVQDIDGDGVSEVISEAVASGQGDTDRVHALFRLDGFKPVVLHVAVDGDNLGNCEGEMAAIARGCRKVDVNWRFEPSADHGVLLVESVVTSSGLHPDHLKSQRQVRRYFLVENTFVRDDWR